MTLIDFDKKELLDIYRALQYTRFEECPVPHDDEGRELYHRLTNLMEKVSKTRSMCSDKTNKYCTWGDGDSLDRERVRDILLEEYNYKFVGE